MCKVLIIPGVKPEKRQEAQKFIEAAGKKMSYSPDNDGFGYACIYPDGNIYGEKWLKNDDAFKNRVSSVPSPEKLRLREMFGDALKGVTEDAPMEYEEFGSKGEGEPTSFLVHARKKTKGDVSLQNTHPFYEHGVEHDIAIIHNGTISNHEQLSDKKYSTCDSEVIMHEYLDKGMHNNSEGVIDLAKDLIGSYAVGVLTNALEEESGEYYPVVDIFKSNKPLFCGYIKELDTFVFATTKEIIEYGCTHANMTLVDKSTYELEDGRFFRLDAVTGDVVEEVHFTPSETWDKSKSTGGNSSYPNTTGATGGAGTSHSNHHRPNNHSNVRSVGPVSNKAQEEIKRKFENNHQDLFLDYFKVDNMTEQDKELLELVEADNSPEAYRAMELVKLAIEQAG